MSVYGSRIKEMMEKAGLKQNQLAPLSGVKESTFSNWLNGRRTPGIDDVENICSALDGFVGDTRMYIFTGKHQEEYLRAFDINESYIAKRELPGLLAEFLTKMNSMKKVVVISGITELLQAWNSIIGNETNGNEGQGSQSVQ